jgi:hypothetical protein
MLLLGGLVFIMLGAVLENAVPVSLTDFRALYYPARCLLQHHDPYKTRDVEHVYEAEGHTPDTAATRQIATQNVYPPTSFIMSIPFALLPWGPAHLLWLLLIFASVLLASILIWDLGAEYAPILSGFMIGFLLANSEVLAMTGNAAGIAISLCCIAVWCFFRERFVRAGILCLAVSLAVKPHDAGLVWLYFLLAGGVYRRRAWQVLLVMIALTLSSILWIWLVSPHWMQEMHTNLLAYSLPGGTNDPSASAMGPEGVIDLQSATSFFWSDPRIYNLASYLICAPLLLAWALAAFRSRFSQARAWLALAAFRSRFSQARAWLALAAIAALSMLPVYHRQYDAKLLLLAVPACGLLWARGGRARWFALGLTAMGLVTTGDFFWTTALGIARNPSLRATGVLWQSLMIALRFSVPVILLAMSIFYVWVFARQCAKPITGQDAF